MLQKKLYIYTSVEFKRCFNMAINPYTLQCLYEKGILDYVPQDLMGGAPIAALNTTGANPYLQMAAQGGLYQNYNTCQDSFTHSSDYISGSATPGIYRNNDGYNNMQLGSKAQTTPFSPYIQPGVGTRYGYGVNFGTYNNQNALGINNDGAYNRQNALGLNDADLMQGYNTVTNGFSNGIRTASSTYNSLPKFVKDITAVGIALLGIIYLFKRGKKPNTNTSITKTNSFLSKLNPKNWKLFKKN